MMVALDQSECPGQGRDENSQSFVRKIVCANYRTPPLRADSHYSCIEHAQDHRLPADETGVITVAGGAWARITQRIKSG